MFYKKTSQLFFGFLSFIDSMSFEGKCFFCNIPKLKCFQITSQFIFCFLAFIAVFTCESDPILFRANLVK